MVLVDGPPVDVRPDRIASRFFLLDQRVVAGLADGFRVLQVEKQSLVALMGLLVVDDGGAGMVPVAGDEQAGATLAGVQVAKERLLPDPMWTAPASIAIKLAVSLGFNGSTCHASCRLCLVGGGLGA